MTTTTEVIVIEDLFEQVEFILNVFKV